LSLTGSSVSSGYSPWSRSGTEFRVRSLRSRPRRGSWNAAILIPVNAFATPVFDSNGVFEKIDLFRMPAMFSEAMLDVAFGGMSQVVSQETYKALEDTLGEEWYADLLRSSVNSVISAGFSVVKDAVHGAMIQDISKGDYSEDMTEEDIKKFEDEVQEVGQKVNDENKEITDGSDDKDVFFNKEKGEIYEVDKKTGELLQKHTYNSETSEFESINYQSTKEYLGGLIEAIYAPSLMILGQGGVGVDISDLVRIGNPIPYLTELGLSIYKSDAVQYWETFGGTAGNGFWDRRSGRYTDELISFSGDSIDMIASLSLAGGALFASSRTGGLTNPVGAASGIVSFAFFSKALYHAIKITDSVNHMIGITFNNENMMNADMLADVLGQERAFAIDTFMTGLSVKSGYSTLRNGLRNPDFVKTVRETLIYLIRSWRGIDNTQEKYQEVYGLQ